MHPRRPQHSPCQSNGCNRAEARDGKIGTIVAVDPSQTLLDAVQWPAKDSDRGLNPSARQFAFRYDIVLIYPAIDLRGGRCVRLRQGDYAQETVFGDDPAAMARRFVAQGAAWLHLVDLDGAKDGQPVNGDSVKAIVQAARIPCQLGGGIRTEANVEQALAWGVTRVIVGTRALKDPTGFEAMCRRFPGKIVLGLDARNGRVATEGWLEVSDVSALDLAQQCAAWPLAAIVCTDISKDGMMQGPNFDGLAELASAVPLPVIASGGVSTVEDVRRLAELRLAGCIIGRALYEGAIDLAAAIRNAECGMRNAE